MQAPSTTLRTTTVHAATRSKPRVCFVAPNAYAALSGRSDIAHIGGAEVQQTLIARALVHRGYSVCFVTWDHGQPDGIEHDGIQVFKTCRPDDGVAGLRFLHPRWTGLWRAMSRANADVYYQRTAGQETGQVALWCRVHNRPFVFAVASDSNCEARLPALPGWRERRLYRYGLRHATRVICQTQRQQETLLRDFQKEAVLIRSCAVDPFDGRALNRRPSPAAGFRALWVGRVHPKKRFEWLLDLAEGSPDIAFDVLGDGRKGDSYVNALLVRAAGLANVVLHGRVPHERVGAFYDRADALICTSLEEGYPNTFLEAWARGTPTVSTFDPDGVIEANELGGVAATVEGLRSHVARLWAASPHWEECSRSARAFFLDHHAVTAAADAYKTLLSNLISCPT